ncbi:YlmC/YmxH family sporulation protein [Chryseomicrobium sp. FSL W7-1435]|uniref:YlmC/YmxH family sporulation protein n=1 Tax=Chryseomicrobium sp. FSL W7-1435 TaxID=2921704 RepID=UPI00315A22AE
MRLSELVRKELVGMQDGKKYGLLEHAELVIEPQTGELLGIEVKSPKTWKGKNRDTLFFISWQDIQVIGNEYVLFQRENS